MGQLILKNWIADLKSFYEENEYGLVVASEGIKLKKTDENAHFFEAAFKKDPSIKLMFEGAGVTYDSFGHPKLKDAGKILHAIINAAIDVKVSIGETIGFEAREADPSDKDYEMTQKLGRAAVKFLREKGAQDRLIYVDKNGEVDSMDLQDELGGRTAQIEEGGLERAQYEAGNQALFPEAPDAAMMGEEERKLLDSLTRLLGDNPSLQIKKLLPVQKE